MRETPECDTMSHRAGEPGVLISRNRRRLVSQFQEIEGRNTFVYFCSAQVLRQLAGVPDTTE